MADRVFQDDPTIPGDERLFRRIPPSWVHWDEHGNPTVSSAAFKDLELSIYLESIMIGARSELVDAIRGRAPGFGLAAITAAHARSLDQAVMRDPLPEELAHGIVYGPKKRGRVSNKLCDGARWVVTPSRV